MPCVTDTGETAADGVRVSGQGGNKKKLTFNTALLKASQSFANVYSVVQYSS